MIWWERLSSLRTEWQSRPTEVTNNLCLNEIPCFIITLKPAHIYILVYYLNHHGALIMQLKCYSVVNKSHHTLNKAWNGKTCIRVHVYQSLKIERILSWENSMLTQVKPLHWDTLFDSYLLLYVQQVYRSVASEMCLNIAHMHNSSCIHHACGISLSLRRVFIVSISLSYCCSIYYLYCSIISNIFWIKNLDIWCNFIYNMLDTNNCQQKLWCLIE